MINKEAKNLIWHVYIVQCKDNKLYTGITSDLNRRLAEHNSGHGGHFTKFRNPVKLVYCQEVLNRSEALKREAEIKKLSRSEKIELTSRGIVAAEVPSFGAVPPQCRP